MPRPNWFFAFPLDGAFVTELPAMPAGFRRYHPDDVHLTLTFLGGCGEASALRALAVLDEILPASGASPISVSLAEIVPMGAKAKYSALSALLGRGREETESLIGRLRDPLSEAAIHKREKRKPKAHVTVARPMIRATETHRQAGLTWASSVDLRHVERTLDRIALYTWHENRRERLFRAVAERSLAGLAAHGE
jgi:RNA 2',3'-cyclic 3'-phosphodiesterase